VDGGLAIAVAAEKVDPRLDLTAGNPPDAVWDRLVREQAEFLLSTAITAGGGPVDKSLSGGGRGAHRSGADRRLLHYRTPSVSQPKARSELGHTPGLPGGYGGQTQRPTLSSAGTELPRSVSRSDLAAT
jgi:hypothetical protein